MPPGVSDEKMAALAALRSADKFLDRLAKIRQLARIRRVSFVSYVKLCAFIERAC